MKLSIFLFLLFPVIISGQSKYTIDYNSVVGENHRFWQAAGHDYLFSMTERPSGQFLLDRIKKFGSIRYLRTHATFSNNNQTGGQVVRFNTDGSYEYDFTKVNRVFHEYLKAGIKPIVEFDFFPNGFAKSLGKDTNDEGFTGKNGEPRDWTEWEQLLHAFMQNLIKEFGKDELKNWYFEVWNEPDSWPTEYINVFYKLYDTFAYVVKSYSSEYKIGGPATYNLYALKGFLDHVAYGKNFKTGSQGAPIDFISHHLYGLSGEWLELEPVIAPQVSRFSQEVLWIKRLLAKYENLKGKEFHLNEWGVCSNFKRTVKDYPALEYRNNEFSPLFLVKLIDCLYAIEDNHQFKTSLLLYWGFSWEDEKNVLFEGNRELTTGGNTPKPILTGFELLSKLGHQRLKVEGTTIGGRTGIIPTKNENQNDLIIAAYNFNETDDELWKKDNLNLVVKGLSPGQTYEMKTYILDQDNNNNYSKWIKAGKPAHPGLLPNDWSQQVTGLEQNTESIKTSTKGELIINLSMKRHSLCILKFSKTNR